MKISSIFVAFLENTNFTRNADLTYKVIENLVDNMENLTLIRYFDFTENIDLEFLPWLDLPYQVPWSTH